MSLARKARQLKDATLYKTLFGKDLKARIAAARLLNTRLHRLHQSFLRRIQCIR